MIAKLVVWGENRTAALVKLKDCLAKFQVLLNLVVISHQHEIVQSPLQSMLQLLQFYAFIYKS